MKLLPLKITIFSYIHAKFKYQVVPPIICEAFAHEHRNGGREPYDIITYAERDIILLMRLHYHRHGLQS